MSSNSTTSQNVSSIDIDTLKSVLHSVIEMLKMAKEDTKPYETDSNDEDTLFTLVMTGILKLQTVFPTFHSDKEVQMWKDACEGMSKAIQNLEDEAKKSGKQELLKKIAQLQKEMANTNKKLKEMQDKYEKEHEENQNEKFKNCIELIQNGKINEAFAKFEELDNASDKLSDIVATCYKDKQLEQVENLLNFAEYFVQQINEQNRALRVKQATLVFEGLFNSMKSFNQLDKLKVLLLWKYVEKYLGMNWPLTTNIRNKAKPVFDSWVAKIRTPKDNDFQEFLSLNLNAISNSRWSFLELLTTKAYDNNWKNIWYVIEFTRNKNITQEVSIITLSALLTAIRANGKDGFSNNGYTSFAFRIHELNGKLRSDLREEYRLKFKKMYDFFPQKVHNLVSGGRFTIRNSRLDEYMYAADKGWPEPYSFPRLYTSSGSRTSAEKDVWDIASVESGYWFTFYNRHRNEYCCYNKDNPLHDELFNNEISSTPDWKAHWTILPVTTSENFFILANDGQYLVPWHGEYDHLDQARPLEVIKEYNDKSYWDIKRN